MVCFMESRWIRISQDRDNCCKRPMHCYLLDINIYLYSKAILSLPYAILNKFILFLMLCSHLVGYIVLVPQYQRNLGLYPVSWSDLKKQKKNSYSISIFFTVCSLFVVIVNNINGKISTCHCGIPTRAFTIPGKRLIYGTRQTTIFLISLVRIHIYKFPWLGR